MRLLKLRACFFLEIDRYQPAVQGRPQPQPVPCGRFGLSRYEGIFTNRSQNSLDRIPDGTSNTLLFGEYTGGFLDPLSDPPDQPMAPTQFAVSWMGVGAGPVIGGLAQHNNSHWDQFASAHPGVVNFCFADGSVRSLRIGTTGARLVPLPQFPPEPEDRSFAIDYWVLQELAGMRDGGVRPIASLVP